MNFFEKYRAILIFLIIGSFIAGSAAFTSLPKESAPEIDLPFYIVSTVYPGGDPETIEKQIIDRMETEFTSISKVKEIKSTAAFNVGIISVEFLKNKSEQDALTDLNAAIDVIKGDFPSEVEDPIVSKINLDDSPIYTFSISGPLNQSILYDKISFLEDDIKKLNGVSSVDVIGKQNKEIQIIVDYDKLSYYNISYSQFISSLNGLISKYPADKKEINGNLYSFEVASYENSIDSIIESILDYNIEYDNGKIVKVSDVSDVLLGLEKLTKKSFIYKNNGDSLSSISFQVKKTAGEDLLGTIIGIKEYLNSQNDYFASNSLDFFELTSAKEQIDNTYNTFISNFRQTSIFILFIVVFFIGYKESLAISIAFPLVYLMTFIGLNLIGYSFNMIVSFSLILTLGIMVDSLIVITEGLDEGLNKGLSKKDAIINSVKTYKVPLISGTLTTIAMFLPLYFMLSGNMGEFMKAMPVTVSINLIFAIIVSLVFLPVIFGFFKIERSSDSETEWNFSESIKFLFATKIRAILVIVGFRFTFIFVIILVATGIIKTDFMALADTNNITVNIDYKSGLNLADNQLKTDGIVKIINDYLDQYYPGVVKYMSVDLGSKSSSDAMKNTMYGSSGSDNYTTLNIKLSDKDSERKLLDIDKIKSFEIKEELQKFVNTIKVDGLKEILVSTAKTGPGGGKPISFNIIGDDFDSITDYVDRIYPKLLNIEGTFNWGSSLEYTNGKIKIIWDLNKLKEFGISLEEVNLMVFGIQNSLNYTPSSTTIKSMYDIDEDEVKIKTYMDFSGNIEDMKIRNIYLSQLIKEIKFLPEIKGITHIDTSISITLDSDKLDSITTGAITPLIEKIINSEVFPEGVFFAYGSDIKEQQQSGKDMGSALLTGLILMFGVLVFQFNNFRYPLIIFSALPLLLIGAFGLLGIMGVPFSFAAQLAIFGLIGVGVNNSILLIESYSDRIKENNGKSSLNIIHSTINSRVKPIFLTTLTTSIGLATLAIKDEMWASLGLAFMGGLIVGSFIMLIYIPAILRLGIKK